MKIDSLKLVNFRNYLNQKLKFSDGLNVIVGKNAQGKTNLLESIYFFCIAKSPRAIKDKELINFEKENAKIEADIIRNYGKVKLEVFFSNKQKKTIKINSTTINRVGDLFGIVNAVYFSPDEMKLVKESPENRRRFLDVDISQMNKNYFYNLLKYEKIIDHRNKLLKTAKTLDEIEDSLSIFTMQASEIASKIIFERLKFIEKLKPILESTHSNLTNGLEKIRLEYNGVVGSSIQEIKEKLEKMFEKSKQKDFELRYTTVGPHRDDFKIFVNDIDVRSFGSQGQQRTATLSLKLSELEIFMEETGEYPLLLLDDVLSELDASRQQKLLQYCKKTQVFLTCTQFNEKVDFNFNLIKVKNGEIYE